MIFITLGSQKFQFNRILIEIDKLMEENKIKEEVFAQIGYSTYKPKNYKFTKFMNSEEFEKNLIISNIIITHGGTGTIIKALKLKKRIVAIPRLKDFGEHVDNHQIQLINEFYNIGFIEKVEDMTMLANKIEKVRHKDVKEYKSNTNNVINEIKKYLDGEF